MPLSDHWNIGSTQADQWQDRSGTGNLRRGEYSGRAGCSDRSGVFHATPHERAGRECIACMPAAVQQVLLSRRSSVVEYAPRRRAADRCGVGRGQRDREHRARVARIDDAVVPQARGREVRIALLLDHALGHRLHELKRWSALQHAAQLMAAVALVRTAAMDAGFADTAHCRASFAEALDCRTDLPAVSPA